MSYPSTSPLFLPREANSSLSSTPANVPFLPFTVPMNLTLPYMFPGTSTRSPTSRSSLDLRDGVKGGILPIVGESSSNTFLNPYPTLASGIVARELDVSVPKEDFRVSAFGLLLSADICGALALYEALRLGLLEAELMPLLSEGRGRARDRFGVWLLDDIERFERFYCLVFLLRTCTTPG